MIWNILEIFILDWKENKWIIVNIFIRWDYIIEDNFILIWNECFVIIIILL